MRSKKNRGNSRHHRFPKCEGGTMHYDNLVAMGKCRHQALHILFDEHGKATMPHRQIEIYLGLMGKAIITDAKEDIKNILDTYGMDLYNPKCYRIQKKRI